MTINFVVKFEVDGRFGPFIKRQDPVVVEIPVPAGVYTLTIDGKQTEVSDDQALTIFRPVNILL